MTLEELPDVHGHAKGEHPPFALERPVAYTPRMLFLWFYHAARRGYPRSINVSDHVNYLTPDDPAAVRACRRALAAAAAGDLDAAAALAGVTLSQAAAVREALVGGMRCSIGVEADNDPRSRDDADALIEALGAECVIRSVHFIDVEHPETGAPWAWPFDNPEFVGVFERVGAERTWQLYADALFCELQTRRSDVVAHFYVPAKFGHWPGRDALEAYEDRLIEICSERGIAIELNTRLLYREASSEARDAYLAAYRRLLRKAAAGGVSVAAGSDAHKPQDQGRGFEVALALLDEAGVAASFPAKSIR